MITVIQCEDRTGLVAAITGVLAAEGMNIISLREHVDKIDRRFFLRVESEQQADVAALTNKMRPLLPPDALIAVNPLPAKKIVVLASKEYHCLADILVRNYFRTLGASVQCVIANHPNLKDICDRLDMPFYQVAHAPTPAFEQQTSKQQTFERQTSEHQTSEQQTFEQQILAIIQQYAPDYLVLAKFMRILSPAFVAKFPARIINIHHSFLPAFAGASPYRQAFERGVKLIGATAHFVTDELDEGPIIAQQIIPVSHSFTAADMVNAGKEIETAVLAKALRLVFEDRVLVCRNKTIVFE